MTNQPVPQSSRRRFLRTGYIVTAAVGITAASGLGLAAAYQPAVEMPSTTYAEWDLKPPT